MIVNITVDLSTIFNRAELRKLVTTMIPGVLPEETGKTPTTQNTAVVKEEDTTATMVEELADIPDYEFAPKLGKRRSKAEIAMHEKELKLGRVLTPSEKGETEAVVEVDDETQEQAKIDTKNKIRINGIAEEATEAAAKELAEEANTADAEQNDNNDYDTDTDIKPLGAVDDDIDTIMPGEQEATIPKTAELHTTSLFD